MAASAFTQSPSCGFGRSLVRTFVSSLSLCTALAVCACEPAGDEAAKETTNPADAAADAPDAYVLQPQLVWVDGEDGLYGTGFVAEHAGKPYIVTIAAFIDTSGPGLKEFSLYKLAKGVEKKIATATSTVGLPGRGGTSAPINDLRDDLVVMALDSAPEGSKALAFADAGLLGVGTKVWFPNKDPGQVEGHVRIEGEIIDVDAGYVAVELAEKVEIQSQGGSPVLTAEGDKVVGVVSRSGETEDGKVVLWLNPARAIVAHIDQHADSPQEMTTVFPGADTVAASRGLEFKFAWPEALNAKVSVAESVLRAGGATHRTSSHTMAVSTTKKGLNVERTSLEIGESDGDGVSSLNKNSDLLGVLMPGFTVGTDGRYGGMLDYRGFKKSFKSKLADAAPAAKSLVADLRDKRTLERQLWTEWGERVETWVAGKFETGSAYRLQEEEAIGALGGAQVKFERFINISDRVACDAADIERSCLRIDAFSEAETESLKAAYEKAKEAGETALGSTASWPEFDPEKVKLRTRVIVLTREETLVTHEVRRELSLVVPGADDASVISSRVERYSYE